MKGRDKWALVSTVTVMMLCLGCPGLLWAVSSGSFLGTDKDEDDFSPEERRKLLDTFFPVPVPDSASDLRIRYQSFQDWHLDVSFTLPPGDFDAYVARLTPQPEPPGGYEGRTRLGDGGFVANASTITVDPATRRVKLTAFTW
jgi:nitrogen fixation-related uncharacterized protein